MVCNYHVGNYILIVVIDEHMRANVDTWNWWWLIDWYANDAECMVGGQMRIYVYIRLINIYSYYME